jgi:hypothetical protein
MPITMTEAVESAVPANGIKDGYVRPVVTRRDAGNRSAPDADTIPFIAHAVILRGRTLFLTKGRLLRAPYGPPFGAP